MFKRIEKTPKAKSRAIPGEAYVRLTSKMLYINSGAMRLISCEYIQIDLDAKRKVLRFTPCGKDAENAFKLSRVKETPGARRIETNNALMSLQSEGLPRSALGKRLPVSLSLDGALLVDYAWHPAPIEQRARAAEGGGTDAQPHS